MAERKLRNKATGELQTLDELGLHIVNGRVVRKTTPLGESVDLAVDFGGDVLGGIQRGGLNVLQQDPGPRTNTTGEMIGQTGVGVLTGALGAAAGMITPVPGATFTGGVLGASLAEDEFLRGVVTNTAGGALGNVGSKVLRGIYNNYKNIFPKFDIQGDNFAADLLRRFQSAGGKVTPSQASDVGRRTEDAISTLSGGGPLRAVAEENKRLLTEKAGAAIGLDGAQDLSGRTLIKAEEKMRKNFGDIAGDVGDMTVKPEFVRELRGILETDLTIDDKTVKALEKTIARFEKIIAKGGKITPDNWTTTRRDFTRNIQALGNEGLVNDVDMFQNAVDAIDNVMVNNLGPEKGGQILTRLGQEREKFRNFVALIRGQVVDSDGDVSAARLNSALSTVWGKAGKLNNQEFVKNDATKELFDITESLTSKRIQPTIGSSGTAERQHALDLVTGGSGVTAGIDFLQSGQLDPGFTAAALMGLIGPKAFALSKRAGPLTPGQLAGQQGILTAPLGELFDQIGGRN